MPRQRQCQLTSVIYANKLIVMKETETVHLIDQTHCVTLVDLRRSKEACLRLGRQCRALQAQ